MEKPTYSKEVKWYLRRTCVFWAKCEEKVLHNEEPEKQSDHAVSTSSSTEKADTSKIVDSNNGSDDKRALYQVAANNIAYFKNMMLNITYYTVLIYGFLFSFKKEGEALSIRIYGILFGTMLVSILLNILFHREAWLERKRVKFRFRGLLELSLKPGEQRKIDIYDSFFYNIHFLILYILVDLFALLVFINKI